MYQDEFAHPTCGTGAIGGQETATEAVDPGSGRETVIAARRRVTEE